jgi:hypothetical protein
LKKKEKDLHFDTIVIIEAESPALLNTLTESRDAFQKWQKDGDRRIRARGDYFQGDDGQWAQS